MTSRFVPAAVLLVALAAWPTAAARADNIDPALKKKAAAIVKFLKDSRYENVGVLRFQLQKGKGKPTYAAGPINGNMATRLENALLMGLDPDNPIGVIRGASAVAAAGAPDKHWNESKPEQRAALFDRAYPLAWGDKKVKPDAFLYGFVRLSEDMRTTKVVIACFDRKNDKVREVCDLEVKTDRTILADSGQSYVLPRDLVKKRKAQARDADSLAELMDQDAADSARTRDSAKSRGPANDYLNFEVFYGDDAQELTGDPDEGGELRVAAPRTGQEVSFRLKNKTGDDIGVVAYVNGTSTLDSLTEPAEQCTRWVIPADGKDYWITGYHNDKGVVPFAVVSPDDDLVKNELADKLGLIEVVVFLKGQEEPAKEDPDMIVSRGLSLRSLSPYYQKKLRLPQKPKSAGEARELAYKSAGLKVPPVSRGDDDGGIIVPDPKLFRALTIRQVDFPNPTPVATPLVIRYADKAGK